jgi:hypothetical protein
MKNLKFILFLCISVTILSCGDDNNTPSYVLSNENIAGSYDIANLNISTNITTTTNSIPITVATASTVGNLFKVDVEMFANGTYTMVGSYTTTYKLTPVVGNATEIEDIVNIDNSGNFTINTTSNTITFSNGLLEDLSGTFEVQVFNENSFNLYQEVDVNVLNNVEAITTNIGFTRK